MHSESEDVDSWKARLENGETVEAIMEDVDTKKYPKYVNFFYL